MPTHAIIENLVHFACAIGATRAAAVPAASIVVKDALAGLCNPDACPHYGRSAGCPPHVPGPQAFRALLETFSNAVVFKIEVPIEALRSNRCQAFFRQLHRIAAQVEYHAVALGCTRARAFAGGACKELFCSEEPDCPVVAGSGTCRHPHSARASMSGYGIDITQLMAVAGWTFSLINPVIDPIEAGTGSICALVLVD